MCPSKHDLANLTERVTEIKEMVDAGKYFTINRARQYVKTTTVDALEGVLSNVYHVLSLDFQKISSEDMGPKAAWTAARLDWAVRLLLSEGNALLLSLAAKLSDHPELRAAIRGTLMEGARLSYNAQNDSIVQLQTCGLIGSGGVW